MFNNYGKCGNACQICMHFDLTCRGCLAESEDNPDTYNCVIFNCATNKNVQSCLSCIDFPCDLIESLSRDYCPIRSKKHLQVP